MLTDEQKKHITNLIASDKISSVEKYLKSIDEKLVYSLPFILVKYRINRNEKDFINGYKSREDYDVTRNKITRNLLIYIQRKDNTSFLSNNLIYPVLIVLIISILTCFNKKDQPSNSFDFSIKFELENEKFQSDLIGKEVEIFLVDDWEGCNENINEDAISEFKKIPSEFLGKEVDIQLDKEIKLWKLKSKQIKLKPGKISVELFSTNVLSTIRGYINFKDSTVVEGAIVRLNWSPEPKAISDSSGYFEITNIPLEYQDSSYLITIVKLDNGKEWRLDNHRLYPNPPPKSIPYIDIYQKK